MKTLPSQEKNSNIAETIHINKLMINLHLLQGLIISCLFAFIVSLGHVLIFDLRVNPRVILQPWLLQNGFLQYINIADEHAPLLPQLLAWLLPIWNGDALLTMKFAQACLIFTSVFGSVLWQYRKFSPWAAIATGAYFIAWSSFGGFWALWYELALSPLYLLIFISLVESIPKNGSKLMITVFISGITGGIAVLIKQQALLVIILFIIWLIIQRSSGHILKRQFIDLLSIFLLGVSIPILTYLGYYWSKADTFSDLFYWMVEFNLTSGYSKLGLLFPSASQTYQALPALWLLIPLVASLFLPKKNALHGNRSTRVWLLVFIIISAIMQYPRYSTMHWATALPFLAIGSGIVLDDLLRVGEKPAESRILQRSIYIGIVILWLSGLFTIYLPYLNGSQKRQLVEFDPLRDLAEQLKARNISGGDLVIFPDSEAVSNLYYLLDTTPPKFWLMTYPWFINEFTIEKWIETLEKERPQKAILFEGQFDWLSNKDLISYLQSHYQTVDTIIWQGFPVRIMIRRDSGNYPFVKPLQTNISYLYKQHHAIRTSYP